MAMRFPTAIGQVELDRAANRFAAVDPDRRVGKIRTGFPIPGAELDDLDLVAGYRRKSSPKIAREPARLEFQFSRRAEGGKKRAFMDTRGIAKLGVAAGQMHWGEDESVGESWRVDEKKCLEGRPKHQTPSSKHQGNFKHQIAE